MGQYFGGQAHGNAVNALRQQQRKFRRQHHWFFLPPVVGELPLGGLGIEEDLQGEL